MPLSQFRKQTQRPYSIDQEHTQYYHYRRFPAFFRGWAKARKHSHSIPKRLNANLQLLTGEIKPRVTNKTNKHFSSTTSFAFVVVDRANKARTRSTIERFLLARRGPCADRVQPLPYNTRSTGLHNALGWTKPSRVRARSFLPSESVGLRCPILPAWLCLFHAAGFQSPPPPI